MADVMIHEFMLGLVKIFLLHFAEKEEICGKEFHDRLLKLGFDLSYGTIYPLFHKLESKGYLKHAEKNVNGKIRKYYSLTAQGQEALKNSRFRVKEISEVLFNT